MVDFKTVSRKKKTLLFLFFTILSNGVSAQSWDPVFTSDHKIVSVDHASLKPHDSFLEMSSVWSYSETQTDVPKPYQSSKYLFDYDCNQHQSLLREVVNFSGPNGLGTEIQHIIFKTTQWKAVLSSDTVSGVLYSTACALKKNK